MAEFENHIKSLIFAENLSDAVQLPILGVLYRRLRYNIS